MTKLVGIVKYGKMLIQRSKRIENDMANEFDYLLKLSEDSVKELWDNEFDELWNNV